MKKIVWFLVFLTVVCMNIVPVSALTLEKYDNPTSFTVEILPWNEVNTIIPNKTVFTIIDVETGLAFNVQRRAGNKHADVQPLTHKDTKIMKKIYNGKWSWKRRAILIIAKDQMLAASMHGMPHGAGALQNGFPGHFCVHFYGSTTHGSNKEDLSHKLMILLAGGKIDNYLREIDPYQVIRVFETAINQGNQKIINRIIMHGDKQRQLDKKLDKILFVSVEKISPVKVSHANDLFLQHLKVTATIYHRDFSREKKDIDFIFWKDAGSGQWVIDDGISTEL